ncbi:hypothetical protein J3E68DRAFT_165112 [Trichoderma sp. SZMC 28012]
MSNRHVSDILTDREAIADAVLRAVKGLDRYDAALFDSAFASEDVTLEVPHRNMKLIGLSDIRKNMLDSLGPLDTTHMISNIRVQVENGADAASLTAYALAQHCPAGKGKDPESPKFLVCGEYSIDLKYDGLDGLWKIKRWMLDVIWTQGDKSVTQPSN